LIGTGQRIGDVLNITVKNVKKNEIYFKQEKTGAEVKIDNPCLPEILSYIALMNFYDDDFLFASGIKKKPLAHFQAYQFILKAGLKVLGKEITPHCFRAYFITELRKNNFTNYQIQAYSGHATSNMIDYYSNDQPKIPDIQKYLFVQS